MVTINQKDTLKITVDPIEDKTTDELANYFRSKLKKKNNIQDVQL